MYTWRDHLLALAGFCGAITFIVAVLALVMGVTSIFGPECSGMFGRSGC